MSDMDGGAGLESALGAAFSETPEAPKAAPKASPVAPPEEAAEDPADLLSVLEPEAVEAPVVEPEFEVEIEAGRVETLPLAKLKELAQRGAKAGRGFEENARIREALHAQVQQAQFQSQFNQAVSADIAAVQALDQQLQQYDKVDWASLYDTDFTKAFQLKEQRDQLRERRAASLQTLNAKQQQYQAHVQESTQRVLAAETEALLAKVPAWRNPEKAAQERGEITSALTTHYGFTAKELNGLTDHRLLVVARDAAAYRKLLANKDARVKQAREAPVTARPGAAAPQPNGRVDFTKARAKLRELGTKGNHQAQEQLATAMLTNAFK